MNERRQGKACRLTNMTEERDRIYRTEPLDILPLSLDQLEVIVDALNTHYARAIKKVTRFEEKSGLPRTNEVSKKLARIQETLQYTTLMYNIRTKKLNEAVARSGGLTLDEIEEDDEEVSNSIRISART